MAVTGATRSAARSAAAGGHADTCTNRCGSCGSLRAQACPEPAGVTTGNTSTSHASPDQSRNSAGPRFSSAEHCSAEQRAARSQHDGSTRAHRERRVPQLILAIDYQRSVFETVTGPP